MELLTSLSNRFSRLVIASMLFALCVTTPLVVGPNSFVLFSLSITFLTISVFLSEDNLFDIDLIDIGLFSLSILSFLSCFWASDISRVWYHGFCWLSFFLWSLVIRKCTRNKSFLPIYFRTIKLLVWFGAGSTVIFVLVKFGVVDSSYSRISLIREIMDFFHLPLSVIEFRNDELLWSQVYNKNKNFVFFFYILTLQILFDLNKFNLKNSFVVILNIFILISCLVYSDSKGSLLILILQLVYIVSSSRFCITNLAPNKFQILVFLVLILILPVLSFYSGSINDSDREFMIDSSIMLFIENPILGVGAGNWYNEAHSIGHFFDREHYMENHNIVMRLLSELGVLGISLLILFILSVIRVSTSLLPTLVIYLLASSVYLESNSYHSTFSSFQFLVFTHIFLILPKGKKTVDISSPLIISFSLLTLFWFIFCRFGHAEYFSHKRNPSPAKLANLRKIYNSNVFTGVKFSHSIALDLAIADASIGEIGSAQKYLTNTLEKQPFNIDVWYAFKSIGLRHHLSNSLLDSITQLHIEKNINKVDVQLLLTLDELSPLNTQKLTDSIKTGPYDSNLRIKKMLAEISLRKDLLSSDYKIELIDYLLELNTQIGSKEIMGLKDHFEQQLILKSSKDDYLKYIKSTWYYLNYPRFKVSTHFSNMVDTEISSQQSEKLIDMVKRELLEVAIDKYNVQWHKERNILRDNKSKSELCNILSAQQMTQYNESLVNWRLNKLFSKEAFIQLNRSDMHFAKEILKNYFLQSESCDDSLVDLVKKEEIADLISNELDSNYVSEILKNI